ncbi:MAG: YidC/Oxa1 family membrane protein insertase [Candidatus Rokuibacteriota bacterium]
MSPVAADAAVRVTTSRLDLVIADDGAEPVVWRARTDRTSISFAGDGDPPPVRLSLHGPGRPFDLARLRFALVDLTESARARTATFEADAPGGSVRVVKSFDVGKDSHAVVMTVRLRGPGAAALMAGRRFDVDVVPGRGLTPAPAAGFAEMLDRVGPVSVAGSDGREWRGFRSRFWAIVVRGADEPEPLTWCYTFYSGPIDDRDLTRVDPALEQLLFSGLWFWLRWLSFALLFLLRGLTGVLGHPGVAIIALAVSVKILLLPLTLVAARLQEQVNATQARLQSSIDAIKAAYRGEARARRTMALYRAEGVHPLYTLKSLLGVLIQLPVLVAVFDLLAEDVDLYRVSFLWIRDLSRPDELLRLPACVPFFGCDLNLLPFLMSGVSLAALLRFRSRVLTPPLVRRQRRNLSAMTLLFFLLFYTFPAGMVLYWTSTNAVQLVGQELGRLRRRLRG